MSSMSSTITQALTCDTQLTASKGYQLARRMEKHSTIAFADVCVMKTFKRSRPEKNTGKNPHEDKNGIKLWL